MASRFSSAKNSIAECDRCGFRYKLTDLKTLVIKTKNVNIKVCPECWEPDQPQLQLGLYPVNDPQAVRDPRPDISYYEVNGSRVIEWGWNPVGGSRNFDSVLTPNSLIATGAVGSVIAGQTIVGSSFDIVAGVGTYYESEDPPVFDTGTGFSVADDFYIGNFGTAIPSSVLGYPVINCYSAARTVVSTVYPSGSLFTLAGFTSDPGQAFFNTLTCNGVTLTSASASYSGPFAWNDGIAVQWGWDATVQFNMVSGQTYTVTLG